MLQTQNNGCCCNVDEDYCHYLYAQRGTSHPEGTRPKMTFFERIRRAIKIGMDVFYNG